MNIIKKFGKTAVTIEDNSICIQGEYLTNWGRFYPFAFERFKRHPQGEEHDWNRPQVIGMESKVAPTIAKWIYGKILNGKLDSLIED
jgi:hypothetical protein